MDRSTTNAELSESLARALAAIFERMLDATEPRPEKKRLLTAVEVAELVRLSEKTVYRDAAAGRIPCVRIGRRVLFDEDTFEAYRSLHVRGRTTPGEDERSGGAS
ncbi:MAG: hypothetical protein BMS9Abin37_0746 [Acidobacteriota bacterium]|nr:MAG: hypothetical protein BMS9Abin37_0746 [Acidobacteriota bacterium]